MRITVATPLYPPDVGDPAPYVKELARRLATAGHTVAIVGYARIPETVPGVRIVAIDPGWPLPIRLSAFALSLMAAAWKSDVLYAENGPAVELAAFKASFWTRAPLVFHIGDRAAHERAAARWLPRMLERLVRRRACRVIERSPLPRPEIMPLEPRPDAALAAYERSWTEHLAELESAFAAAREPRHA